MLLNKNPGWSPEPANISEVAADRTAHFRGPTWPLTCLCLLD